MKSQKHEILFYILTCVRGAPAYSHFLQYVKHVQCSPRSTAWGFKVAKMDVCRRVQLPQSALFSDRSDGVLA